MDLISPFKSDPAQMGAVARLARHHRHLRDCLDILSRTLAQPGFGHRLGEFLRLYDAHEKCEDQLFKPLASAWPDPRDLAPLRGYRHIHREIDTLLKELQSHAEAWPSPYVHRGFFNIRLMLLSHLDFEEQWMFPVLDKALRRGLYAKEAQDE